MPFNVFVSYSTKDLDTVNKFVALLDNPMIKVFCAEYSVIPSESLSNKIYPAIDASNIFLLLFSKNSQESQWVSDEIKYAKENEKLILPVLLDKDAKLPDDIQDIKYLPAHTDPEDAIRWVSEHIGNLAQKMKMNSVLVGLLLGGALIWLLTRK